MKSLVFVFIGGGLGSICRYLISLYTPNNSVGFPTKTFLANILSCIILGLLMGYMLKTSMDAKMKLLLVTGFCGGFSTFSTFSSEVMVLIEQQQYNIALIYILSSVILCTLLLFGAYILGQNL